MAITLSSYVTRAARSETSYATGGETLTLAAGKSLKVETSPDGAELLNIEVPSGKSWTVTVEIKIAETVA